MEQGKDTDNDIFWGVVSQRMGGKRGRQQCRIKWYGEWQRLEMCVTDMDVHRTDSLAPQLKNTGERPRWSPMDAYILVHKYVLLSGQQRIVWYSWYFFRVDSMNVRDDTEIDWKLLPDENWNIWSAHSLQRRWLTMKRGIKGFEEMSHAGEFRLSGVVGSRLTGSAEIMEILKTKKAQSPPPSSSGRKKKNKYLSAEAVNEMDDIETQPQAGSSSGPGTLGGSMG